MLPSQSVDPRYEQIARRHGIPLMLQFGSTVRGSVHPDSDVDIAVRLATPDRSLTDLGGLAGDIQALHPEREVDLVVLNRADPLLLRKVTEHCRLLWGTPRTLREFEIYAFKAYQDHRRYLDLEREYVARFVASGSRS